MRMWAPHLWAMSSRGAEGPRVPLKPPRPPHGPRSINTGSLLGTASQEGALPGHDPRRVFWETLEREWGSLVGWGDLPCGSCHPNFPMGLVGHLDTDSLPRAPGQGGVCPTRSPETCLDLAGPLQKESPRPCLPGAGPAARAGQGGGTRQGQLRTGQDVRSERPPAPRAAIDVPFGHPAHPLLTARP